MPKLKSLFSRGRDALLPILMLLLVGTVAAGILVESVRPLAGLFLLLVAVAGFSGLVRPQKVMISILSAVGIGLAFAGVARGYSPDVSEVLAVNQDIMAMILSASFVAIVARPDSKIGFRLRGKPAVFRTALVTHLLGSVISLSAVILVGDRLRGVQKMSLPNALLLSRTFSIAAFWSPFWAAAAAALTFAPGADVSILIAAGFLLAMLALVLGTWGVIKRLGDTAPLYRGYPLSPRVIFLPLMMVFLVVWSHWVWPDIRTTNLVLLCSLLITVVLLALRSPRSMGAILFRHVRDVLPTMRGESSLFASAGVLAVGFSLFLSTTEISLPRVDFGVVFAWVVVILVVALSTLGIHQIITIGVIATLIAPLNPDPTLFAMACTAAWGCSAAISPIGGLHLYIMGRFGVDSFTLSKSNILFVGGVVLLALPILGIVAYLQGVGWW